MTLGEALKTVSYLAQLQVVEYNEDRSDFEYLFHKDDFITRETLEKFCPDLLIREMKDGFHADGIRPGIYCHI